MKDFEKMRKYLERDFEISLVLYVLLTIPYFFLVFIYMYAILLRVVIVVFFVIGIDLALKGKPQAAIVGILISILMILTFSLVSFLGIFMLIHSILYLYYDAKKDNIS